MGVIVSTTNQLAGSDYTVSIQHLGAGSSTVLNSVDRLLTRQLADACRIEHAYPGSTSWGSTVVRIERGVTWDISGKIVALLGVDFVQGVPSSPDYPSRYDVRLVGRDAADTIIYLGSPVKPVVALSSGQGLPSASFVKMPPAMPSTLRKLDIELKPIVTTAAARTLVLDIGGVWMDDAWESDWPIGGGWKEGLDEAGATGYSRGRQGYGDSELVYRTLEFAVTRLTEVQKNELKALLSGVGKSRPLIVGTRVAGEQDLMSSPGFVYGSVSTAPTVERQGGNLLKCALAVTEEF